MIKYFKYVIWNVKRRIGWFVGDVALKSYANLFLAGLDYFTSSKRCKSWPAVLKIDISPKCNLHCTVCVHAYSNDNPLLESQEFNVKGMSVEDYKKIIDEVKGKTSAVSLYYLGDPLVHPDLPEMARIAKDARMKVHVNTNFSFKFKDERLYELMDSGITHFTVCVDGLSQENYQKTRVGGSIELVLKNLRTIADYKTKNVLKYPIIEVQYIKYQHNIHELEATKEIVNNLNIDAMTDFWGSLHNYTDFNSDQTEIKSPRKRSLVPLCFWPWTSMLIKYNGDVIPCCSHRTGEQYNPIYDSKNFGNVFKKSIQEIWNSDEYIKARKLASNPGLANKSETELQDHFCYGCSVIYNTNREEKGKTGSRDKWEDNYTMNEKNRPVPITTNQTTCGSCDCN